MHTVKYFWFRGLITQRCQTLRYHWHRKFFMYNQSWARDNSVATKWPCYHSTKLFVVAILLYLLLLPHLDTEAQLFFDFCLVPEAILRCRVVAKLNNCCVPSSVYNNYNNNNLYSTLACPEVSTCVQTRIWEIIWRVQRTENKLKKV